MLRLCVFLVVVAISAPAGIARAQTPLTIEGEGGDISIVADRIEESGPDRLLIATGNVEITRGLARLTADRVELSRATGDAVATGRVIFYDGQDRLSGERLEYNLRTGTGVIHDAQAFSAPYYRLSGERVERLGPSVYGIRRGIFTTCEDDPAAWSVHFGSATADLNGYLYGRDASFWVRSIPIIPFFPFFATALRRERQTGFLAPVVGNSSRKGLFAKLPFFWAISDSQDLTVSLDAFSKRGVGGNAEYRYILSERNQGVATGFFVEETELENDLRGYFRVRHTWTIDPTLSLRADVNHVSDDDLFREYGDRLSERSLQRVNSNLWLTKRWGDLNFVGNLFWYEDLTTPVAVELQRLPDLKVQSARQPVPGLPGALWQLDASATHFVREVGSEGSRLDIHPRLLWPFRPFALVTVTPFVGARATTYDQRVVGTAVRESHSIEVTEDTLRTRALGEAGADLELRAMRVWDVNAGGFARLAHVVEPRLGYTYAGGVNTDSLPQWDNVDGLNRQDLIQQGIVDPVRHTSVFVSSLTNRLLGKTVAGPDETPARLELARLVVSNAYDADRGRRPFGDIRSDLIIDPNRYVRFRADAAYSLYHGDPVRKVNSDISLLLQDLALTVGTRYDLVSKIQFFRGEATGRVSRYLSLRGSADWDADKDVLVETRLGADLHFQCWAFSVTYVHRSSASNPSTPGSSGSDDEFRFSLDLLGVGAVGTRTGIGF